MLSDNHGLEDRKSSILEELTFGDVFDAEEDDDSESCGLAHGCQHLHAVSELLTEDVEQRQGHWNMETVSSVPEYTRPHLVSV